MALQVIAGLAQNSTRNFLDQLVKNGRIKAGFKQVLGGKDLDEIGRYLLEKELLDTETLSREYADFFRLPFIHLTDRPIEPEVANMLPLSVAEQFKIIPYAVSGRNFYLAVGKPSKLQSDAPRAISTIRHQKGLQIHLSVAPEAEVDAVILKLQSRRSRPSEPAVNLSPTAANLPATPPASPALQIAADSTPPVQALNKKDLIEEVEPRGKRVDLTRLDIPKDVLVKIPYDVAKKYKIVVFGSETPTGSFEPPQIKVALVNPDDAHVKEIMSYIETRNKVLTDRYQTDEASFAHALSLYERPAGTPLPSKPVTEQPKVAAAKPAEPEKPPTPKAPTPIIDKIIEPPVVTAPPKAPPVPAKVEERPINRSSPKPVAAVTPRQSDTILTISPNEIVNRPNDDSAVEVQRASNVGEATLEDQDLDKLLKQPITSVEELAKVYRTGIIPEIVAATLFLAIRMKASDAHLEAEEETMRLRYRIDGVLHDVLRVPSFLHAPLISRIKILAKMKIDEQRVPQDGRFDVTIDQRQVDLRVSTMPTVHGEKIVMRLLDKTEGVKSLEQLGVTGSNFDTLIQNINKPYGIILSTGPTGSGKSTTLYAILTRISKPGVNIVTLEDPVEYELPGINQAQVKPQIGFTFAEGLRSVLRQDPNIIMVGEIRDLETAAMATHAALTGHLVLSTLHTNDAAGALPRLINMGVEPFLITSSINAVVGQRLVRRICDNCRDQVVIPPAVKSFVQKQLSSVPSGQLKNVDLERLVFYHGRGCPNCTNGYRGRIGIFEVLPMTDKIEDLAVRKETSNALKQEAIKEGMITMMQDGLMKALKGITTVDEVMRVTTASFKEVPGD